MIDNQTHKQPWPRNADNCSFPQRNTNVEISCLLPQSNEPLNASRSRECHITDVERLATCVGAQPGTSLFMAFVTGALDLGGQKPASTRRSVLKTPTGSGLSGRSANTRRDLTRSNDPQTSSSSLESRPDSPKF